MKIYKVEKYNLGDNDSYILESPDQDYLVEEVLKLTSNDNGRYTYRIEAWENNELVRGSYRFFQNGSEFTDRLRKVVSGWRKEKGYTTT